MPKLTALNTSVNADLVVFDKDGTLIDFHALWGPRAERAIETICSLLGSDKFLATKLAAALGYNPQIARVISQGPLASGTRSEMEIVVATILFQHGIAWDKAKDLACRYFGPVMTTSPTNSEFKPRGKVQECISRLKDSGIRIAIATSDDRKPTEAALRKLKLTQAVDLILCADDPGTPSKPDPSVLDYISQQLLVSIDRTVMVGDTVSDLTMAKKAGVALTVGITGGADKTIELEPYADVLLSSVDSLSPA
uniref:Predicted phosphatases n=2 Tax=Bacteria TaxID=2 RepID=E7C424_9GAMM|nr:predicted phosphatases [uncultured gamma proteobacterium HF0200_34B07]ADI22288.1 predicted phosphatases [uncultured actinobacterium HF0200_46I24]